MFDWSAVDWAADDPFEACKPEANRCPAGASCERRACRALLDLLQKHRQGLPLLDGTENPSDHHPGSRATGSTVDMGVPPAEAVRRALAKAYVAGQRRLLEAAAREIRKVMGGLPPALDEEKHTEISS